MPKVRPALTLAALLGAATAGYPVNVAAAPDAPATETATEQSNFQNFIREFRDVALGDGVSPELYDRAMADISFNPRIEELNEKQPEFVRPIWDYLAGVVTPERIGRGRGLIAANEAVFRGLRSEYGVPPQVLTAIWGIETAYGRNLGLVQSGRGFGQPRL